MSGDSLHDLLRRVDGVAGDGSPLADDLAGRVRKVARRRRIARNVASVGVLLVLTGIVGNSIWRGEGMPKSQVAKSKIDVKRLQDEVVALRADANVSMAAIDLATKLQEKRSRASSIAQILSRPDAVEEIRRQQDRAALILFCQADRAYEQPMRRQDAVQEYKNLVQLFPETHWAKMARQKLERIGI